jgi:hypothetical protein
MMFDQKGDKAYDAWFAKFGWIVEAVGHVVSAELLWEMYQHAFTDGYNDTQGDGCCS